jgi:hypothetical protein
LQTFIAINRVAFHDVKEDYVSLLLAGRCIMTASMVMFRDSLLVLACMVWFYDGLQDDVSG